MRSQPLSAAVHKLERSMRFLRWFYIAVIPIYFVVPIWIGGWPAHESFVSSNPLAAPLTVTAALTVVFGKVVGRMALPGGRLWRLFAAPSINAPGTEKYSSEAGLTPEERRLASMAPAAFTVFIVEIACYEAVALYGMVLALVCRKPMPAIPFQLAAIILIWTVPPNLDRFFDGAGSTATM
jgi:hypothetical protein